MTVIGEIASTIALELEIQQSGNMRRSEGTPHKLLAT